MNKITATLLSACHRANRPFTSVGRVNLIGQSPPRTEDRRLLAGGRVHD